jgi:hypothetical protein
LPPSAEVGEPPMRCRFLAPDSLGVGAVFCVEERGHAGRHRVGERTWDAQTPIPAGPPEPLRDLSGMLGNIGRILSAFADFFRDPRVEGAWREHVDPVVTEVRELVDHHSPALTVGGASRGS